MGKDGRNQDGTGHVGRKIKGDKAYTRDDDATAEGGRHGHRVKRVRSDDPPPEKNSK